jgi:hypothetical protein
MAVGGACGGKGRTMAVNIHEELQKAYAGQIQGLFDTFCDNVAGAKDKDAAIADGGQKFLEGVKLVGKVLAKANELTR